MRFGSSLFALQDAVVGGVGSCLHKRPPNLCYHLNSLASPSACPDIDVRPAVTRAQLEEVRFFDTDLVSWGAAELFFRQIHEDDLPLNITDGKRFPWWVFLAGVGERSLAAGSGVNEVFIVRDQAVHFVGPLTFLILRDDGSRVRLHKRNSMEMVEDAEYNRLMGIPEPEHLRRVNTS